MIPLEVLDPVPKPHAPGRFAGLAEHPLPRLMDEGLFVTLNSDDPPMSGPRLTREYRRRLGDRDEPGPA